MRRKKIILFAGILLCLLVAAGIGYRLYNQPRASAAAASTDDTVSAKELYSTFAKDEQTAGKLYVNKVLEVTGTVMQVDENAGEVSVILSAGETETGGVNCSLVKAKKGDLPKSGETVRVKGLCTGFLMDVSLVDATILTTK